MSIFIFSIGKISVGILCVTLALLIIIIAYKKLLAYLDRGRISSEKYCELYTIESEISSGEIEFYFTAEETKHVNLELLNSDMTFNQEIASKEFKSGGNIIRFDSRKVSNGLYYYQLRTENQKTMKKIIIEN